MTIVSSITSVWARLMMFINSLVDDNIPEDKKTFSASLTLDPADQARFGNRLAVSSDVATATVQDDEGKK